MRLIDGDKLKELMKNLLTVKGEYADSFTNKDGYRSIEIQQVIKHIDSAEKYDASTIKHAHWYFDPDKSIGCGITVSGMFCSNCGSDCPTGSHPYRDFKYCPHCGARMDEETENG